jgi:hypothetical protein
MAELYHDILTVIFRVLWAEEHAAFLKCNRESRPQAFTIYKNCYGYLARVCKKWREACKAVGFYGYFVDLPLFSKSSGLSYLPDINDYIINKYGILLSKSTNKELLGLSIKLGFNCWLQIGIKLYGNGMLSYWENKTENAYNKLLKIFGQSALGAEQSALYAQQSALLPRTLYDLIGDNIDVPDEKRKIIVSGIEAWLSTITVCGQPFKLESNI